MSVTSTINGVSGNGVEAKLVPRLLEIVDDTSSIPISDLAAEYSIRYGQPVPYPSIFSSFIAFLGALPSVEVFKDPNSYVSKVRSVYVKKKITYEEYEKFGDDRILPCRVLERSDNVTCVICCHIFNRPTMVYCCHVFCNECLRKSMIRSKVCPICRSSITDEPTQLSPITAKSAGIHGKLWIALGSLVIRCNRNRCFWVGKYAQFINHLAVCRFIDDPPVTLETVNASISRDRIPCAGPERNADEMFQRIIDNMRHSAAYTGYISLADFPPLP